MLSKWRMAFLGKLSLLAMLGLGYCTIGCHHDHDDDEGGRHAGYSDRGDYYGHDHAYDREHDRYDRDFH